MSVPNTGHFEIELSSGQRAVFDGREWKSSDSEFLETVRPWSPLVKSVHADVRELGNQYLEYAQIKDYRIIKIEYDEWEHELPEGAID